MHTLKTAVHALKEGKLLLVETNDAAGIAVSVEQEEQIAALREMLPFTFEQSVVLVGEIGMLYNFVEKIPDLALDVVEYADPSVDMIYGKAKNIPLSLLSEKGEVKIRLIQQGPVHQLLFNLRGALLYIPVTASKQEQVLALINNTLNLQVTSQECGLKEFKVMKLGFDGEVKFY